MCTAFPLLPMPLLSHRQLRSPIYQARHVSCYHKSIHQLFTSLSSACGNTMMPAWPHNAKAIFEQQRDDLAQDLSSRDFLTLSSHD